MLKYSFPKKVAMQPRTTARGSFSTTNAALQEALSYVGKGTLRHLMVQVGNTQAAKVRITVDDVVVLYGKIYTYENLNEAEPGDLVGRFALADTQTFLSDHINAKTQVQNLDIDFKKSLKIEICSGNSVQANIWWIISEE